MHPQRDRTWQKRFRILEDRMEDTKSFRKAVFWIVFSAVLVVGAAIALGILVDSGLFALIIFPAFLTPIAIFATWDIMEPEPLRALERKMRDLRDDYAHELLTED
jgi:hypothetical protein